MYVCMYVLNTGHLEVAVHSQRCLCGRRES